MRRVVLYLLFFLSGFSALVYELIWQRLLHLVFGVSTLAVSAVLAAFMGGLALGGLLFGRMADRSRRPERGYALLEGAIAGSALLVPPAFTWLTDVYTTLHVAWQPEPWGGALLRFALALGVLLVPATLIGGTVPFMARLAVRRRDRVPSAFSLLYGINTLGAVAGAALTGLVLLRYLGMQQTLWIAVALNAFVGVAVLFLRQAESGSTLRVEATVPAAMVVGSNRLPAGLVLACAVTTGAVTTGLEVAWTRVLGIFSSNSAYAFALVLSVLLLGLAVGGLLQSLWARRPGDPLRRLALCQWALAGLTLATLPYFRAAPAWFDRCCDGTASIRTLFLAELSLTAGVLFLPAVLMGLSFPLLVSGLATDPRHVGRCLGRVYAGNTLGCVLGAFLAGFVLVPHLGLRGTLGLFAAGNLAVGLIAWAGALRPARLIRVLAAVAVISGAFFAWHRQPDGPYLKAAVEGPRHLLYYREGNNGTVSVTEEAGGIRHISVDGQPVAGTSETSVLDQKMLAHLPLLLHPEPHRALTVGFGSGGTSYSMSLHDIDVDCVEIERAVPDAAEHFRSENHGIRHHPRFRLVLDDARSWLQVAPQPYDVIVTDCTNIQYKSNGDLYTVEYFQRMRDRLTEQGIAAAWVPANGIDPADLKTLLRSFRQVFPHTSLWFMDPLPTDFLIVVGTPGPLSIDLDRLSRRMQKPEVHDDLATMGLADPCRMLSTLLCAEADVGRYLGDGPLHTDDRPVLSYSTYGATYRVTIPENLLQMLSCRSETGPLVRRCEASVGLLRNQVASSEAILGHIAFMQGRPSEALAHYVAGARLLPEDATMRRLVVTLYGNLQQAKTVGDQAATGQVGSDRVANASP